MYKGKTTDVKLVACFPCMWFQMGEAGKYFPWKSASQWKFDCNVILLSCNLCHCPSQSLVLLGWFVNEGLMDVWDDTTTCNGALDQSVKLFISTNGKLQVPGCDALHLQILTCISCKFQNLSCQVLQNGCWVHSSCCPHPPICSSSWFQKPMNSTNWKLQKSSKARKTVMYLSIETHNLMTT